MEIKSLHKRVPGRKLRVAAYGRISNDKESLEPSLQEQISYYVGEIILNPNWEFAGMFYDNGISGTSIKERTGFIQMIDYAKAGMIDIILVKSISRFARNVVDLLEVKRELAGLGIEIYFEQQNISSLDPSCDFALTLYAQIAESEALSVSKNVKWRVDKNMREGKYYLPVNQMLGYRYNDEGKIVIYEDEAKWIRECFKRYAHGEGTTSLANWLNDSGIKTSAGNAWTAKKIRNLLRNEKYVGDVLFQKRYVENPLDHKTIYNHGQRDQYLLKNAHPKIIDRVTFDKVQKKLSDKANKFKIKSYEANNFESMDLTRTAYSSFIKCPYCGSYYQSRVNHYNGKATRFMVCASNRNKKRCDSEAYKVEELNKILVKLISSIKSDIPSFKKLLLESFRLADEDAIRTKIDELTTEISQWSYKYRNNCNSESKFMRIASEGYLEKAINLANKKNELVMRLASTFNNDRKVKHYLKVLDELPIDESLIEESNFKDFFSNCVIVNQDLIYFSIGRPLSYISTDPKLFYESEHEYIIRKTTFKTKYGIVFN